MGEFPTFKGRDLDLGSGHIAYQHASVIDLYLHTKFHWNQRNFLWMATYCQLQSHVIQKLGQKEELT